MREIIRPKGDYQFIELINLIRHGTVDEDIPRFIQRKKHLIDSMHIFAENALANEFKEVIMAVLQVEIIKMDVTHDVVA